MKSASIATRFAHALRGFASMIGSFLFLSDDDFTIDPRRMKAPPKLRDGDSVIFINGKRLIRRGRRPRN